MKLVSKRGKALDEFKEHHEIGNIGPVMNEEGELCGDFSTCDVCESGLKATVYECNGYSPKHNEVYDGFELCNQCLAVEANGFDSKYELELDNQAWDSDHEE